MTAPFLGYPLSTGIPPDWSYGWIKPVTATTAPRPSLPQAQHQPHLAGDTLLSNNTTHSTGPDPQDDVPPAKKRKGRKAFLPPKSFLRGIIREVGCTETPLKDIGASIQEARGPGEQWLRKFLTDTIGLRQFSHLRYPKGSDIAERRKRHQETAQRAAPQTPAEQGGDRQEEENGAGMHTTQEDGREDSSQVLAETAMSQLPQLGEPAVDTLQVSQDASLSTFEGTIHHDHSSLGPSTKADHSSRTSLQDFRPALVEDPEPGFPNLTNATQPLKRKAISEEDRNSGRETRSFPERAYAASKLENKIVGPIIDRRCGSDGRHEYIMRRLTRKFTIASSISSSASVLHPPSVNRTEGSDYKKFYHSPKSGLLVKDGSAVATMLYARHRALRTKSSDTRVNLDQDLVQCLKNLAPKSGSKAIHWLNEADARGTTPLHLAVAYGCPNTCAYLIDDIGVNTKLKTHQEYAASEFARPAQHLADDMGDFFWILTCRQWVKIGKAPPVKSTHWKQTRRNNSTPGVSSTHRIRHDLDSITVGPSPQRPAMANLSIQGRPLPNFSSTPATDTFNPWTSPANTSPLNPQLRMDLYPAPLTSRPYRLDFDAPKGTPTENYGESLLSQSQDFVSSNRADSFNLDVYGDEMANGLGAASGIKTTLLPESEFCGAMQLAPMPTVQPQHTFQPQSHTATDRASHGSTQAPWPKDEYPGSSWQSQAATSGSYSPWFPPGPDPYTISSEASYLGLGDKHKRIRYSPTPIFDTFPATNTASPVQAQTISPTRYNQQSADIQPLPVVPDSSYLIASQTGAHQYQTQRQHHQLAPPDARLAAFQAVDVTEEPRQVATQSTALMTSFPYLPGSMLARTAGDDTEVPMEPLASRQSIVCEHGVWLEGLDDMCDRCFVKSWLGETPDDNIA